MNFVAYGGWGFGEEIIYVIDFVEGGTCWMAHSRKGTSWISRYVKVLFCESATNVCP